MDVRQCVTDGGIPTDFTPNNLRWLAQAHRDLARRLDGTAAGHERALWHIRWATLVESILENHRDHH